jgi:hypothetical protein
MIVDMFVDHPPGGAEQAYQRGREKVARVQWGSIRLLSLLSRRNPRRAMRGRANKHAGRAYGILGPGASRIDVSPCEPPICGHLWGCLFPSA